MAVSIQDIAERANVSITTVSRVLNHNESVRASTRQRVQEIIKACDYRPNVFARGLMLKRTDNLGLILPAYQDDLISTFIRAADGAARRLGQGLMVSCYESPEDACRQLTELAHRSWIDGVAVMMNELSTPFWEIIRQLRLPAVVIDLDTTHQSVDNVRVDHYAGGSMLVRHLIDHHHVTKPLYLADAVGRIDILHRCQAFRDLANEHGLINGTDRVYRLDGTHAGAKAFIAERLGAHGLNFDAIVADNAAMLCGALAASREAGIVVPDQLKVVGFDDLGVTEWLQPAVTTVKTPIRQVAEQAVERLHDRIRQPDEEPKRTTLRPELMIRESCGCSAM
jgi:LacI family transcriptional regulator